MPEASLFLSAQLTVSTLVRVHARTGSCEQHHLITGSSLREDTITKRLLVAQQQVRGQLLGKDGNDVLLVADVE